MSEYRYGINEIAAACSANDAQVDPALDHEPISSAEDLLDPVSAVLKTFGVDPEAIVAASMGRATLIAKSGELHPALVDYGGLPLLASWGAAWMDGFAAALRLVGPVDGEGD